MNTDNKTLAVYGAAFNPPHLGHADAICQLLERRDGVIVVPAASHAFGKPLPAFDARLLLVEDFLRDHFGGDDRVVLSGVERELLDEKGQGPVYSIETLDRLAAARPGCRLTLAIGPDNARPAVWRRFRDAGRIERDYGVDVLEERVHLHSSEIRGRLSGHLFPDTATRDWLASHCGKVVAGEIIENALYR